MIIFTEKADAALEALLQKYKLLETPQQEFEKFKAKKQPNIVLVDRKIRDFAEGKIKEVEMASSLSTDLGIPQNVAGELAKEAITTIVPLLEKVTEGQNDEVLEKKMATSMIEDEPATKSTPIPEPTIEPKVERIKKATAKPAPEPQQETQPPATKSGDKYREPIE